MVYIKFFFVFTDYETKAIAELSNQLFQHLYKREPPLSDKEISVRARNIETKMLEKSKWSKFHLLLIWLICSSF